uniref:Uncharacterized protein n=1 Tax=Anguilla anguilla TaxID=7936 RepID=A0A0E9SWT2_ANGAN
MNFLRSSVTSLIRKQDLNHNTSFTFIQAKTIALEVM